MDLHIFSCLVAYRPYNVGIKMFNSELNWNSNTCKTKKLTTSLEGGSLSLHLSNVYITKILENEDSATLNRAALT